jgi:predicted nucleic acid-binding protein
MLDRENKFLDSNILIYAYFDKEKDKQIICRKLISNNKIIISTQVLQEMSNVLNRKVYIKHFVNQAKKRANDMIEKFVKPFEKYID